MIDFLPTLLAVEAMKEVMTFGNTSIEVIAPYLVFLTIWGIIGMFLGIVFFQRKLQSY